MGLILKRERGQNEDSNADITNGFCSNLLKLEKDKEASKDPKKYKENIRRQTAK